MKTDLVTNKKKKYYSQKLTWSLSKKEKIAAILFVQQDKLKEIKGWNSTLIFKMWKSW